jgi:small conductance mechanosensitive channel
VNLEAFWTIISSNLASVGLKLIAAIALWIVGRWLIRIAIKLMNRWFKKTAIEPTLFVYARGVIGALLNIVLVVAILGFLGVETTSFAALLAGVGLAIGTAWGGQLTHFAAGFFIVVLQPFQVGHFISSGSITGTVEEIGLFTTTITRPDNVKTIVSNNTFFANPIENFSANPYRRVELVAQLDGSVDYKAAIARLKDQLSQIENIETDPAPDVEVLELNPMGPVLAVRPYCHQDHYWPVYFATNQAILDVCGQEGYPAPKQHYTIHQTMAA